MSGWGLSDLVQDQPGPVTDGAGLPAGVADYAPVIDVGGSGPSYNPAAKPGEPGSELVSTTTGPGDKGAVGGKAPGKWGLSDIALSPAPPDAPATASATPPAANSWGDLLKTFGGNLQAAIEGIPRGAVGDKTVDYANAALGTLPGMVFGAPAGQQPQLDPTGNFPVNQTFRLKSPVAAFQEALQTEQAHHKALGQQYPVGSIGGEMMGGAGLGLLAAPALGWRAAAGILPRLGSAATYIARNAGLGGLMSTLSDDGDTMTGMALGAVLPALHVAGSTIAAPIRAGIRQIAPMFSQASREASVGRTLDHDLGTSVPQTSPVGPLDLGQATNNATVAAKADIAQNFAQPEAAALRTAQQGAVDQQLGQIGQRASSADAGGRLSAAIRTADDMARAQERALWNVPALKGQPVQTSWVRNSMKKAVADLDPGLQLGITGPVKQALDMLQNMPDQATVGSLNSVRGALLSIARKPPLDNPWARPVASKLASEFLEAMERTLNSSKVDPEILRSWQAARDFSRQYHGEAFNYPDLRAITAERNGAPVADASEASKRLFNFSFGSPEGPRALDNLTQFVAKLKDTNAGPLADNIKESARAYIAAAMRNAGGLNEGQNLTPARIQKMQDFIRINGPWMRNSGLFDQAQVGALKDLSEYLGMLRRPAQLLQQAGSQTNFRGAAQKTFIAEIMNPWARRVLEIGGTLMGGHHGGMIGAGAGVAGSAAFEGAVSRAENAMREMMARAVLDPQYAQALQMKATAANRALLPPRVRDALDTARSMMTFGPVQHAPEAFRAGALPPPQAGAAALPNR